MNIIYKPKGKAAEYAALALNIYNGCSHRCRYCYAPGVRRTSREKYFAGAFPRADIVNKVRRDCEKLAAMNHVPEILMTFLGDPYPLPEIEHCITRRIIETLIEFNLPFTVLTKGGTRAMRDFDLMDDYPMARFGTSLVFLDEEKVAYWEPGAQSARQRIEAIRWAKARGIPTWVSLEPVIDPTEAMRLIENIHGIVDHWKVGKINYNPAVEKANDWSGFRADVSNLLRSLGADYYIKNSLKDLK
jgi:DNA repair photolyase